MFRENQPAQTYDMNMLASVLGRTQVQGITSETARQIVTATDEVISILDNKTKPPVPHTEPHLIAEALKFVNKLRHMLNTARVEETLPLQQREKITILLNQFEHAASELARGRHQQLISPKAI